MALIKCPECGRDISDQAEICIGCGCPIKRKTDDSGGKEKGNGKVGIIAIVIGICVILGVFIAMSLLNRSDDDTPADKTIEVIQKDLAQDIIIKRILYNEELNACIAVYSLSGVQDMAMVNLEDQSVLYWSKCNEATELMEKTTGDESKKYAEMVIEYADFIMEWHNIRMKGIENSGWIELE